MEDKSKASKFEYTYSAKEQEEIKKIRQKYQPQQTDKLEQLRKLDAGVISKATAWSMVAGIIGILIMGSGMSLAMTNIGESIGLSGNVALIVGIIIGVIGMTLAGFAYPVYSRIVKTESEKIAPEILRLTDELIK